MFDLYIRLERRIKRAADCFLSVRSVQLKSRSGCGLVGSPAVVAVVWLRSPSMAS